MTWIDPTTGPQGGLDEERIRRAFEALSHSASVIHVRADAPVGGGANVAQNQGIAPWTRWFDTTNKLDKIWSPTHNLWITLTPQTARDTGNGTRALNSYGDLTGTGVGPAVTLDTGTIVIVTVGCRYVNLSDQELSMGYAVTGASSVAAADARRWSHGLGPSGGTLFTSPQGSYVDLLTGLTAGPNTFTAKYKASAGTGTVENRTISVQAIPT